jgi:hypothetical protein
MKMSFKMPVCFESQQITTLLEAVYVINGLSGECGRRELRTDKPKNEAPYTVCHGPLPGQHGRVC